jgi:SAM-dependent methyltransferase
VRHTNYDDIAGAYDRRYSENDYSGIEHALSEFVGSQARRVLEVGCGTGHWVQLLHERHVRIIGIDRSPAMLAHARSKRPGSLVRALAEGLPLADRSIDRLFCINAHHHFPEKRTFLTEAYRVLRPGGSMMTIALDPHNGRDQWWIYDYFEGTLDIDKQRYPSCEALRAWMGDVGFSNVYTREVQHLPGDVAAREALQNGMVSPNHTSQLAVLTTNEFDAGMARIRAGIARDDSLRLSADLRVYATYGTRV